MEKTIQLLIEEEYSSKRSSIKDEPLFALGWSALVDLSDKNLSENSNLIIDKYPNVSNYILNLTFSNLENKKIKFFTNQTTKITIDRSILIAKEMRNWLDECIQKQKNSPKSDFFYTHQLIAFELQKHYSSITYEYVEGIEKVRSKLANPDGAFRNSDKDSVRKSINTNSLLKITLDLLRPVRVMF